VDRRCKTNNQSIVNRNGDMMAMVRKKFRCKLRVDWIVEHACGDVAENGFIATVQDLDFDSHRVAPSLDNSLRYCPDRVVTWSAPKIKLGHYPAVRDKKPRIEMDVTRTSNAVRLDRTQQPADPFTRSTSGPRPRIHPKAVQKA